MNFPDHINMVVKVHVATRSMKLIDQASESRIPNKNVAINKAKPTMVADLSRSSCSIVIFPFLHYGSIKQYKIYASNFKKKEKLGNFYVHNGICLMSFRSIPIFSHP